MHTVRKKSEVLIMRSKESGVEVNADKVSTWPCIQITMQEEMSV